MATSSVTLATLLLLLSLTSLSKAEEPDPLPSFRPEYLQDPKLSFCNNTVWVNVRRLRPPETEASTTCPPQASAEFKGCGLVGCAAIKGMAPVSSYFPQEDDYVDTSLPSSPVTTSQCNIQWLTEGYYISVQYADNFPPEKYPGSCQLLQTTDDKLTVCAYCTNSASASLPWMTLSKPDF